MIDINKEVFNIFERAIQRERAKRKERETLTEEQLIERAKESKEEVTNSSEIL